MSLINNKLINEIKCKQNSKIIAQKMAENYFLITKVLDGGEFIK